MLHVIVVTWAQGICLICMPKARWLRAYIRIRQIRVPMLQVICITSGTLKLPPKLTGFSFAYVLYSGFLLQIKTLVKLNSSDT